MAAVSAIILQPFWKSRVILTLMTHSADKDSRGRRWGNQGRNITTAALSMLTLNAVDVFQASIGAWPANFIKRCHCNHEISKTVNDSKNPVIIFIRLETCNICEGETNSKYCKDR